MRKLLIKVQELLIGIRVQNSIPVTLDFLSVDLPRRRSYIIPTLADNQQISVAMQAQSSGVLGLQFPKIVDQPIIPIRNRLIRHTIHGKCTVVFGNQYRRSEITVRMHSDRNTLATKQQESLGRTENIVLVVLIQFIVRLLNVIMRIPCVMSGGIRIRMRRTVRELDAGHDHYGRHKECQNSFQVTFVHEKPPYYSVHRKLLNRRRNKPLRAFYVIFPIYTHTMHPIISIVFSYYNVFKP